MRPNTTNFCRKTIYSVLLIFFVSFAISSCARKLTFGVSPVVPAAEGTVKIKKSKNDNYILDVRVKNLAEPNRLSPPANVYVVWMESNRNAPKNMGMIKSASGFFSNKLKASMTATSTVKPTSVFITAENNGQVRYPSSQVVLTTR